MRLLIIGSVALDSIETAVENAPDTLGGSAVYASGAAGLFTETGLVGVVGSDFPLASLDFLRARRVDLSGLAVIPNGQTFRWGGRYSRDLSTRESLFTELGVFATFDPKIPEAMQGTELVFLGNIEPTIQRRVVEQMRAPKLVAMDTMNFWIHGHRAELLKTLQKVNVLLINDEEARDLSGEINLVKAARAILRMGPSTLIIKRGEHGAMLFHHEGENLRIFYAPAFPLEDVKDPTGAGDTFAGAFMGALAKEGQLSFAAMRRAVVQGSLVASFVVQGMGTRAIEALTPERLAQRQSEYRAMLSVE
jgi:sugar/nucleoside kinase (ribokinase family)